MEGLSLETGRVQPALTFELRLDSLVEGILVSGQVQGVYDFDCSRCLSPFSEPFSVAVSEVLAYEGQPGAEDGYEISGDHAHLEPVVRDVVMLAMPLKPLCREDCKGLCPICGADLNAEDCGHDRRPTDLRWEPLARLRERVEE